MQKILKESVYNTVVFTKLPFKSKAWTTTLTIHKRKVVALFPFNKRNLHLNDSLKRNFYYSNFISNPLATKCNSSLLGIHNLQHSESSDAALNENHLPFYRKCLL